MGQNLQSFLRGALTQLHQTYPRRNVIIAALHFYFKIRISYCIFQMRVNVEWGFKRRQISLFLPTPCEN